jgi:hypothetical protein
MDAAYLREKAAICLRLARGLSWNNPARSQLLELAEDLDRQAQKTGGEAPKAASPIANNRNQKSSD